MLYTCIIYHCKFALKIHITFSSRQQSKTSCFEVPEEYLPVVVRYSCCLERDCFQIEKQICPYTWSLDLEDLHLSSCLGVDLVQRAPRARKLDSKVRLCAGLLPRRRYTHWPSAHLLQSSSETSFPICQDNFEVCHQEKRLCTKISFL